MILRSLRELLNVEHLRQVKQNSKLHVLKLLRITTHCLCFGTIKLERTQPGESVCFRTCSELNHRRAEKNGTEE